MTQNEASIHRDAIHAPLARITVPEKGSDYGRYRLRRIYDDNDYGKYISAARLRYARFSGYRCLLSDKLEC